MFYVKIVDETGAEHVSLPLVTTGFVTGGTGYRTNGRIVLNGTLHSLTCNVVEEGSKYLPGAEKVRQAVAAEREKKAMARVAAAKRALQKSEQVLAGRNGPVTTVKPAVVPGSKQPASK